jgi:uncharacterized protein
MEFEWDEGKNRSNVRKHGIDFSDAIDVFNHLLLTVPDLSEDFGEERWIALGWMWVTVAVVVYVERSGDTIRVISARKATRSEAQRYAQRIGH